jgi:hypothetical protein
MSLLDSLLTVLASAPTQHERLLRLHTPLGAEVLLAEQVGSDECIGPAPCDGEPGHAGWRTEIHALAADGRLEL